MGFLISAILELIWIIISGIFNVTLAIFFTILKAIPVWLYIVIAIIIILVIIKKIFLHNN